MTLNPFRALHVLYCLGWIVLFPKRVDKALAFARSATRGGLFTPIAKKMMEDPELAPAFRERHQIRVDIQDLMKQPEGSLGRRYAEHMTANKLDVFPEYPSDDPAGFFLAHHFQAHDFWHVATGNATDIIGEIGFQTFAFAQLPGAAPAFFLAVGFLRAALFDGSLKMPMMESITRNWRMGRAARPLFGVHWDELCHLPLGQVQLRLGLPVTAPLAFGSPEAAPATVAPIALAS